MSYKDEVLSSEAINLECDARNAYREALYCVALAHAKGRNSFWKQTNRTLLEVQDMAFAIQKLGDWRAASRQPAQPKE